MVWHCRCFYVVIRLFGTNFGGFQKTQMLSSVGESHSQIVYFRGSHSRPDASFRVAFNDLNVDRTKSLFDNYFRGGTCLHNTVSANWE